MSTADGWVTVTLPEGDGWACTEDHVEANNVVASLIRCVHETTGPPIHLVAKDYTVPPGDVTPADELFSLYYENNYRRMFSRFDYLSKGPVGAGYEVLLDADHPDLGAVRMRERATVADTHVLLLTAQCGRDAYEEAKPTIDRWFAETRFKVLEPAVARGGRSQLGVDGSAGKQREPLEMKRDSYTEVGSGSF